MDDNHISEEKLIAAGQSIKEQKYWLKKFSGQLPRSAFPHDYTVIENDAGKYDYDSYSFQLPQSLSQRLNALSSQSPYVMHMVLVACVSLLLARYTANDDIIIGTTIEKQEMDARFINTVLPLRNNVAPDLTFKQLLIQVRATINEADEHQNYPIDTLLYDLKLPLSADEFPLFDVAVLMETIHDETYIESVRAGIIFSFHPGELVSGTLKYKKLFFQEKSVKRYVQHLHNVLQNTLFNVDMPLAQIDILSEEEKNCLVYSFNRIAPGEVEIAPSDLTIQELFARQVEKTPGETAVVFQEQSLTYRQLAEKAGSLASLLKEKGVGAETVVGIMAQRSLEMIIGMMAILKAGAAYLPLAPEGPAQRSALILTDSRTRLLLTKDAVEGDEPYPCPQLDLDREDLYTLPPLPPQPTDGGHMAYVIYTSGSTGIPKGVAVNHGSIVNTLLWRKAFYAFDTDDTVLQMPAYTFDSSVEDIFTSLISGSKLVLIPQEGRLEVAQLETLIKNNNVTHMLIVPTLYKTLLEEVPHLMKNFKHITVAGDHFKEDLVKAHFAALPHVQLYNEYGPTENSVCSTVYRFSHEETEVLIGKPIDNALCYILDKHLKPCPTRVWGELHLSGPGLARGYLNQENLTDQSFVPNPFVPGTKMFRTGDLARWRDDGNIEFLGRQDSQVKIRGFRVEIGEIEKRLQQHESVKEAVVIDKEDKWGSKYLCAYVVPHTTMNLASIMEYLLQQLPDYMIPAHFIDKESLPLTPNGKIDRKKLKESDEEMGPANEYVPPSSEIEKKLVEIWQAQLGLVRVGIKDNFFNVGGDSIKSIALLNIINKCLQLKLKVADLYINNTIEKLAFKITTDLESEAINADVEEYDDAMKELEDFKQDLLDD